MFVPPARDTTPRTFGAICFLLLPTVPPTLSTTSAAANNSVADITAKGREAINIINDPRLNFQGPSSPDHPGVAAFGQTTVSSGVAMDQWGRGPVIMEERRDSVEEATLSKDAIVGAIAALAASAPVKNSCSISNSHSSEKVGPPPNYFSRSVQTKVRQTSCSHLTYPCSNFQFA